MRLCIEIKKTNKQKCKVFFCTIPVIVELQHQGIYSTGTIRINRFHGAQEKLKSKKQLKKEGRRSLLYCEQQSNHHHHMLARQVTNMASSCAFPNRRGPEIGQKRKRIKRPYSVMLYNQHMGGVDVMDQCVAKYPHRGKNKQWYIQLFFDVLDVATINSSTECPDQRRRTFCISKYRQLVHY